MQLEFTPTLARQFLSFPLYKRYQADIPPPLLVTLKLTTHIGHEERITAIYTP